MTDIILRQNIFEIIANELGLDLSEIHDGLAYNSVPEWDSVAHMILVAALEERFQIEIDADLIAEMTTAGDVQRIVSGAVAR